MNIYGIIILSAIIIGFVVDFIADNLNISNLKKELPKEFVGVYDDEKYSKSQEYTVVNTKFGYITTVFGFVVTLTFWFSGGFPWLNEIGKSLFQSEIARGIFFISALLIANSIIELPFGIYSTFVIEEKFGFNKTTAKTYILDLLKSILLSVVIGLPVLGLLLYLLGNSELYAYGLAWLATVIIGLIIQYIAPVVFLPLFNKFVPLEDGELKSAIFNFAEKVKYPLKNIFVMDGSKRSTKSNAFFIGFGKNKRIVLFDTLIEKHSVDELVSILAHEIGHFKKRHILTGTIIGYIRLAVIFCLLSLFIHQKGLHEAFFMNDITIYAGLLFFGMLYSPIDLFLSIYSNILSRKHEYEADKYAAINTGNPEAMINALKKLSEHNLSNLTPHPFYVFLHYSHPTVLERIEAIRRVKTEK